MIDFNYTILVQFFNFLILMILLNFLLFKPVLRVINKRNTSIGSLFEKGKSLKEEAERLAREYDDKSREMKKPILAEKESLLTEAHNLSMRTIDEARADLAGELERIKEKVASESTVALDELKVNAGKLSNEVAQKILQRSLS